MAPISKKRRLASDTRPVESLTFDPSARNDYLTGFHKRKQARIQSAREAAIKREKEEKVRERKQLREQRKEDLESHIAAVNTELKKQNAILNGDSDGEATDDDEEFAGFDSTPQEEPAEQLPSDEEYVDEDRYTTVTVEPMGEEASEAEDEHKSDEKKAEASTVGEVKKKRPWAKGRDGDAKKVKKKKFRYESKAERAFTRQKQKSKNSKAAKARRKGD